MCLAYAIGRVYRGKCGVGGVWLGEHHESEQHENREFTKEEGRSLSKQQH